MYGLYKKSPSPERKELLVKLSKTEYTLWLSVINADKENNSSHGSRPTLDPDRQKAFDIAKELL